MTVISAWLRIRAQPRNPCQPHNSASASTCLRHVGDACHVGVTIGLAPHNRTHPRDAPQPIRTSVSRVQTYERSQLGCGRERLIETAPAPLVRIKMLAVCAIPLSTSPSKSSAYWQPAFKYGLLHPGRKKECHGNPNNFIDNTWLKSCDLWILYTKFIVRYIETTDKTKSPP